MRRLERLEAHLRPSPVPFFRVQFYRRSEDGTLIRLDGGDEGPDDAQYSIRVVFVDPKKAGLS
jgi:hypothetical protein